MCPSFWNKRRACMLQNVYWRFRDNGANTEICFAQRPILGQKAADFAKCSRRSPWYSRDQGPISTSNGHLVLTKSLRFMGLCARKGLAQLEGSPVRLRGRKTQKPQQITKLVSQSGASNTSRKEKVTSAVCRWYSAALKRNSVRMDK